MPNLIGIGGVFIFAQNTELLAAWYARHLGFELSPLGGDDQAVTYYQELGYRELHDPRITRQMVFAIMPAREELSPIRNQAMINHRVHDLDALVAQLNAAGVATEPIRIEPDGMGQGKFTHCCDPEGNCIELWQHLDPH